MSTDFRINIGLLNIGSVQTKKSVARNSITCLNAYMLWIGADCYSIKPAEALKKYPQKKWITINIIWVRKMILKQDPEGLVAMRNEYTKKTGNDWKEASLRDVLMTLGDCSELWKKGKVLIDGNPNVKAIFQQIGVNDPKLTTETINYLKNI